MESNKNSKLFNAYVFLTTFSRNLLEVFVGSILYKLGFSLHTVIFYYLLVNLFSIIIAVPATHISKKYSNKFLSIVGISSFLALQIVLLNIKKKMIYIYAVAFLFSLYRRAYWIARRYYTMQIIDDKKNIATKYSVISILNQLGVIVASYCGSLFLQFFTIKVIIIISAVLLTISLVLLFKLNFEYEKNDIKLNLIETMKCTPKSSMLHISCYEMQNVVKFLFPLFIIIYIKDTYTAVGIINLLCNISSLIFTYIYGRLINNKKNFLRISIFLVIFIKLCQINTSGIILMILSFIEGFACRMYEQSLHKEHFKLSKSFEYFNYNYMYEMVMDLSRLFVVAILFLFVNDVRVMLYVTLAIMSIPLLVNFKTESKKKDSPVLWKE